MVLLAIFISNFSQYMNRYHGTTMFLEMYHSRTIIFPGVPCKYHDLPSDTVILYQDFL